MIHQMALLLHDIMDKPNTPWQYSYPLSDTDIAWQITKASLESN